MSTKNSIQVGIKMRPLLAKEKDMTTHWLVNGNTISSKQGIHGFEFDFVFDEDASNQAIFEKMAKHIVHSAVHGFNGTIFAYGQTASGKTYTMMGEEDDPGVMVLAAKQIFKEIDKMTNCEFLLRGGFIEIYNEKIYDLLSKSSQELKIHEGTNGNAHVNCKETCITSEEQLLNLLEVGNESRTVGETNMNERSSRSHGIFRLIIESRETDSGEDGKVTQSVLNLVDLAGSERADQTGASGARLKEGGHINKSLLFLSNVISRLSENEDNKYINYRDSKLTRILQASLGGNAFTSIICTVTPISVDETHSTLSFAMRAKTVKNKPHVNEIISDSTMMKRLTREIQELKKELEVERRKNTSQLRLNQIEQYIGLQEHKFINSLSLKNCRTNNDNRRRTWCAGSMTETSTESSTNPFINEMSTSRLKPPKPNVMLTPHVTMRDVVPEMTKMDILEEEFEPAINFDFNKYPSSKETPKKSVVNGDNFLKLSLSPNTKNTSQHVELLEKQYASLQEFANLEKEFGVDHDVYGNVKFKLEAACKRNEMLESERVEYLATKNELYLVKEQLNSFENRCDNLQVQIAILQNDKQDADKRIEQYESEVLQLKGTIQSLETENRNAVSLQFEFESHRKKSKLREKELLELLDEKDRCIAGLDKQLKSLQAKNFNQSKEELMQLVRCTAGDSTENDSSDDQVNKPDEEGNRICLKCKDLQRLLDDNRKVALEFDELTLQYRELQNSFENVTAESQERLAQLDHWQNEATKFNECEELRNEISVLRLRLEKFERDYEEVKCDRDEKSESCKSLCREIEVAQDQLCMVQNKYTILEGNWREQEEAISVIKTDYDLLEKKYNELKTIYTNLEHSSSRCSADCERLQSENDGLQNEIQSLKTRVEEMQTQLLNEYGLKNEPISTENGCSDAYLELRSENNRLQDQLKELQTKFESLLQENDQLSTNIMETVQENDTLMASCKSLNAERISWESERASLEERISEIQQRLDLKSLTVSSTTSGDDDELHKNGGDIAQNQSTLLQNIDIIELACGSGKCRTYTAVDTCIKTESATTYKLSLEKWQSKKYTNENGHDAITDPVECGVLKAIISSIKGVEMELVEQNLYDKKTIQQLQERICNLEDEIRTLQFRNEALFESSQQSVNDLRDEIKRLTTELFEKSVVLEEFVKERAEMTLLNEELQMKIVMSQSDNNITNSSAISAVNQTMSHGCIESMNDVSERSYDNTLKIIRTELMGKEEECNQLKLEMLEKIELAKSEFRSNLRKYNDEWEQNRRKYKERIGKLETMLINEGITIKKEENNDSLNDSEMSFVDDVEKEHCESEENYANFHGAENSSTPNTPSTSSTSSKRYLEIQKSRLECSQIVQECNEQVSKLSFAIEDAKGVNTQLSESLTEREALLQIKDAEIESLKAENLSMNNNYEIAKKEIQNLEKTIKSIEMEIEKRDQELKAEYQFKNETEKNLKHLQCEYDTIFEERNSLFNKVHELMEQNKASSSKMNENEQELSKLQQHLDTTLSEMQKLQSALKASQTELSESLKLNEYLKDELERLKKQQEENQKLVENMKTQIDALNKTDGEHTRLQAKLIMLKSEYTKSEKALNTEKADLMNELEECKKTREELREKSETLTLKIEALAQKLHESKLHSEYLQKTLEDHKDMEKQLDAVSQDKKELELEVTNLRNSLSQLKDTKQLECKEAIELKEQEFRNQITILKTKLDEEQNKSNRENKELQSQLNELQYKLTDLKETNAKLVAQNKEIEEHLATANSLQRNLQDRLETSVAENEKFTASLQMKLKEQEKSLEDLRVELATKETAKLMLESTISKLQSENKNLIDRMEELNEIVKKRSDVCESANNSMETSVHSQNSPLARWSPSKTLANGNAEDKFTSIQKERRNRRLSTHDENRRQSSKLTVYIDASTMTETIINGCQCEELKRKLTECETQLYIRESQVKALNYELRNHPLKTEKQTLIKRIQEEQEKNRLEVKKYKTKISEQAAKIQALTDLTNIATTMTVPTRTVTLDQSTSMSPRQNLRVTETQTDMDIDQSLHKLQGKYNDLKNICRFRYNRIASLEKQIEEKENLLRGQCTSTNQQQCQQVLTAAETSSQKISSEKRK